MVIASPRAGANAYPAAPLEWGDSTEWSRQIAQVANGVLNGKINATGTVILTANQATSTLTDKRIGANSVILFEPRSASAKTEGQPWTSGKVDGSATLNHVNSAVADRTYGYCVFG